MRSLTLKLILAFLVVSLIGTALVALFAVLNTKAQFNRFVADQYRAGIIETFADYYQETGSWEGLNEALPLSSRRGFRSGRPDGPAEPQGGLSEGPTPMVLLDRQGRVVLAGPGYHLGDQAPPATQRQGIPVRIDGQLVGRLILVDEAFLRRSLAATEVAFLNRVNQAVLLGTLGATAVALVLAVLLARTLTRPLRELTVATKAVAQGDLEYKVPVRSEDELGQLAASFNQMNADLARVRDQRRQMTADIAHDLRTPLSLILGHTEALNEGVLPPTKETLYVIHDEARRLSRLVDDLRTLSLAEAGEMQLTRRLVEPRALLERAAMAHAPRAKQMEVDLQVESGSNLPEVMVDPDRIAQVLDNLLSNALRYTPAGGRVTLSAHSGSEYASVPEVVSVPDGVSVPEGVRIIVQDSGPGVAPEELSRIFERFYRADKSRHRGEGGSGLGLAIARSIVNAHGGQISAESEPGKGLSFIIDLPLESDSPGRPGGR